MQEKDADRNGEATKIANINISCIQSTMNIGGVGRIEKHIS